MIKAFTLLMRNRKRQSARGQIDCSFTYKKVNAFTLFLQLSFFQNCANLEKVQKELPMNKSIRNVVFIGIFLLITGGLFAQTPQELRFDTWVSGNLRSGGDDQWFSVRPTQTGYVVVETRGDIDTYLEAYDASYEFIDENDDGGEGYNARLEIFAQAGRTYLFLLTEYYGNGGPYQIRASFRAIPQATELRLNSIVSGNIREGEDYWYSIRATQAGFLVVETTGSTDTFLDAYDESYNWIDWDDDSGDGYNARLKILAEAGKTYIFRLKGYGGYETGPYRISASMEPMPEVTELRFDTMVSGNIRLGEEYWYSVRATQAGFVTVQTSGTTDTYLEAYDSSLTYITEDDDSGGGVNASVRISVEAGKLYYFILSGYDYSSTSGPYSIQASFSR
jgi:hypothetical protein